MESNPLNIVDIEWPNNDDIIKDILKKNIPIYLEMFRLTFHKIRFGDLITVTIYCVLEHLIEYKKNTLSLDLLPLSIVKSMENSAIEILNSHYAEFNEYWYDAFRATLNKKLYQANIIAETNRFTECINLQP